MIPGELFPAEGTLTLNADREAITLMVANTGDRPVQVGSHFHFAETNPALDFDRDAARGLRLDIAAGTAVRFEPGQRREVQLIPLAGARRVFGFNGKVMGPLALALALLLGAPDGATAQESLDCSRDDLPQQAMNACSRLEYEAADAELNRVWSDAIAAARAMGIGDRLLTAQRAWIPFRDAACEAEAALFDGGTMAPLIRNTCLTDLTRDRTEDLTVFLGME